MYIKVLQQPVLLLFLASSANRICCKIKWNNKPFVQDCFPFQVVEIGRYEKLKEQVLEKL